MQEETMYIGKNVPKVDALAKVTGAVYGHDVSLPGMLHGKILRSAHPHAKVLHVDVRRAWKVPGVHTVLTGSEVQARNIGLVGDQPILKGDKVRSMRDEVAAVAAVSEEAAEEAIRKIRVKYEPLPAVFDPREAMREGAPLIHDNAPGNVVPLSYAFKAGDAEEALARSAHVVEGSYATHFVTHACMEPCFTLAAFDPRGTLTLWSTTQIPYLMQNHLSRALGIPGNRIRILQPMIGGAFGSKLDSYPYEYIAILLAKASGRPVRILFTREEEFISTPTRQPTILRMWTGCDAEGRLTARRFEGLLDNGAYTSWGVTTPQIMLVGISSLYRVPNIEFKAQSIYTNNPYSGAFRGYGNPQGTFANEQQVEELARKIGMDPVEFRLLNANQSGDTTPQGFRITTCGLSSCLREAAQEIGYHQPKGEWEGVGIASSFHVGGGGRVYKSDACGVIAKLDDFGRLTLITGATEIGTGSDTAMAMIAAEDLGIPLENVTVVNHDTDIGPWDVGIHASRTTFIGGNAVLGAVRDIKDQLRQIAASMMHCDPEEVLVEKGVIYRRGEKEKALPIDKVVRAAHFRNDGQMIVGKAFYDPPNEFQGPDLMGNVSATYSFATHAVRVKVDPGTGKVKVLKFVAAHDVGKVINRHGLEGQIEGAIAQGLGFALTEQVMLSKGRMINPSFLDYKILTAPDMPEEIVLKFIETNDPEGPFGAKGVSEAGLIPTPAAVANAVADAIGRRIFSLPLTPEKILNTIREG
ncbi:MAG: xanthine dehydrogenase family protein molybdopterin-binding subunit [Planctomycetota bacterium]|jgi:xanthine dehydrogenase molybdenum-binding subunit